MKAIGIIPSRYESTRFPGKPLVEINGKTMIQRVYEQSKKATSLTQVMVATDDHRIFNHVKSFNGEVVMTSSFHKSGTERCAEAVSKLSVNFDIVINIQGDEPFINPEQINQISSCFDDSKTDIATLIKKINSDDELFNSNRPKVEIGEDNFAKMFSRNAIPEIPSTEKKEWLSNQVFFRHIGIYGYRTDVLAKISQLPVSQLEEKEGLEQLRWLENNYAIKVAETEHVAISIDTPEDLKNLTIKP